jgi:glycosyltransferase involved in cell wall biosynthesis
MTLSRMSREFAYRSARSLYGVFKKILGPAVRSRPRLHQFLLAQKEAFKELLRPSVIVYKTPLEGAPLTLPAREPEAVSNHVPRSCLPGWLLEEWRDIHELEPELFPDSNIELHIITDFIRPSLVGRHYLDLCQLYGEKATHVLLVPWLKSGGADLVVLNYVKALTAHKMAGRVVVISTENADSPWAKKLPMEAQFIEFGKRYSHLSPEEQEKLLTRVFLQLPPSVIHNINSLLGYNIFIKYGKAITETSRLYACAFCEDITPEGRSIGYPVCFLPQCFDSLTAVLSDNQHILDKLRDIFGFEREKLFVHYQPMTSEKGKLQPRETFNKDSLDILWASRLDIQKRPDVLIKVAENCKTMPFTFHVYGSPVYGTSQREVKNFIDTLNALPNVRYYGPFDGLSSLPTERFDLFLYTSQWDGLPNVLLEAISLGLPVIASSTGGIPELISDGETGFIVDPFDNIDGYVDTLKKIHWDRSVLHVIAGNSLKLLESRHSWMKFNEELRKVPFYVADSGEVVLSEQTESKWQRSIFIKENQNGMQRMD